ncbi:MAG: hypothetical protein JWQ76_3343, partial [Ramlibacter sp.]|nr:hypothetical protein [Ramlibacter sp.]
SSASLTASSDAMDLPATAVDDTRHCLERAVIGLNQSPLANAVQVKEQVHFAVSEADDAAGVLQDFGGELEELLARDAQERDTTLLVIPRGFADFLDFHDLTARAERLLRRQGLEGVVQLASFHPRFVFAGEGDSDITNNTNRAPYPTLHLLREASMDRAVAAFPDAAAIYETNMDTLRRLGQAGWDALGVGASK